MVLPLTAFCRAIKFGLAGKKDVVEVLSVSKGSVASLQLMLVSRKRRPNIKNCQYSIETMGYCHIISHLFHRYVNHLSVLRFFFGFTLELRLLIVGDSVGEVTKMKTETQSDALN